MKLHSYGIRRASLRWIRAFICNRRQKVVVEDEESDSVPVTFAVPQSSVLGPILFLVYINDLPEDIVSKVRLFADYTAIYITLKNKSDSDKLQRDLDRLHTWTARWDMEFNPSKRQVVRVTSSRTPLQTQYILHGQMLEAVSSARYLGWISPSTSAGTPMWTKSQPTQTGHSDLLNEISKLTKKENKDQASIQSSTTPDPGYQWESDNVANRHHTPEPRGQPFPNR